MRLCNENRVIVTERLEVRSMPEEADTKRLPGWIADAPREMFLYVLEYKA